MRLSEKIPEPDGFIAEFQETFKGALIIPIPLKLFQKTEEEKNSLNSFHSFLIRKPDKVL
jgi:hypothetical protein